MLPVGTGSSGKGASRKTSGSLVLPGGGKRRGTGGSPSLFSLKVI